MMTNEEHEDDNSGVPNCELFSPEVPETNESDESNKLKSMLEARKALLEIEKRVANAVGKYENASQEVLLNLIEIDSRRAVPVVYKNNREMMSANKVRIDTFLRKQDDNRKKQEKELQEATRVLNKIQNSLGEDVLGKNDPSKPKKQLVTVRDAMDAEEERLVEEALLHAEHVVHLELGTEQARQEQTRQRLCLTADRMAKHARLLMELKEKMAKRNSNNDEIEDHVHFLEKKSKNQYHEIVRLRKLYAASEVELGLQRKETSALQEKLSAFDNSASESLAKASDVQEQTQTRDDRIAQLEAKLAAQKLIVRSLHKRLAQRQTRTTSGRKDSGPDGASCTHDARASASPGSPCDAEDATSDADEDDEEEEEEEADVSIADNLSVEELRAELLASKQLAASLNAGLMRKHSECDKLKTKVTSLSSEVANLRRVATDRRADQSTECPSSVEALEAVAAAASLRETEDQLAGAQRRVAELSVQLVDTHETIRIMKEKHLEMVTVSTALIESEAKLADEVQTLRQALKRKTEQVKEARQQATKNAVAISHAIHPQKYSSGHAGGQPLGKSSDKEKRNSTVSPARKLLEAKVAMLERELLQVKATQTAEIREALAAQGQEHKLALDRLLRLQESAKHGKSNAALALHEAQRELIVLTDRLAQQQRDHESELDQIKSDCKNALKEVQDDAQEELEHQRVLQQKQVDELEAIIETQNVRKAQAEKLHQELEFPAQCFFSGIVEDGDQQLAPALNLNGESQDFSASSFCKEAFPADGEPLEVRQFAPSSMESSVLRRRQAYAIYCKLLRETRSQRTAFAWFSIAQQLRHRSMLLRLDASERNGPKLAQLWTIWLVRVQRVWQSRREMCLEREDKVDRALYLTMQALQREEASMEAEGGQNGTRNSGQSASSQRIDPQRVMLHELLGPSLSHNILPISNAVLPTRRLQKPVAVHLTPRQLERIRIVEPFIPSKLAAESDSGLRGKLLTEIVQYVIHGQQAKVKAPLSTRLEADCTSAESNKPPAVAHSCESTLRDPATSNAYMSHCSVTRTPTRPNTASYSHRRDHGMSWSRNVKIVRPQSSHPSRQRPASQSSHRPRYQRFGAVATPHHDVRDFPPHGNDDGHTREQDRKAVWCGAVRHGTARRAMGGAVSSAVHSRRRKYELDKALAKAAESSNGQQPAPTLSGEMKPQISENSSERSHRQGVTIQETSREMEKAEEKKNDQGEFAIRRSANVQTSDREQQLSEETSDDLQSLSSLEDEDGPTTEALSAKQSSLDGEDDEMCNGKPIPRFADGSKCHPQRRCHFLEIPFGTSGALKRRVFEVRERIVEPCGLSEQVVTSQPCLRHATTNMVVVRWDVASWPEAKRVTHFEVQWRQVGLGSGEYLEVYALNPEESSTTADGAGGGAGELEPAASRHSTDSSDARSSPHGLAAIAGGARVEVICDGQFSTMPSAAVRQIDLRGEVRIHGLGGACAPLIFRVRTKIGHLGWGQWSPDSEPIQTLPHVCDELTPRLVRASAHSLQVGWSRPYAPSYGKVARYRLYAALAASKHCRGDEGLADYCDETLRALNESDDEDILAETSEEVNWVLVYEGLAETLTIGQLPQLSAAKDIHDEKDVEYVRDPNDSKEAELERAHKVLLPILSSRGSNLLALGIEQGLLPSSWPVFLRLEADTGSWFHGEYYENDVCSPATAARTLDPIPDAPPAPEILPYHGSVQARELSLRLASSSTYGSGHDTLTYALMYPCRDATDWFGVDVRALLASPKEVKRLTSKRKDPYLWKSGLGRLREDAAAETDDLRKAGWVEIDPGHWRSSLSHEERVTRPFSEDLPVSYFSLMGRIISPDIIHPFKEMYRGPQRHVRLKGLEPTTKYEFYVTMTARRTTYGASPPSARTCVSTARAAAERLTLPPGWVELWDPVSEYIYFHETETRAIQWEHPAGADADDPDLRFRKIRFRLLHRLYERLPPAQNVATHKIYLDRKNLVKDSYREVGLLKREQLNARFNVHFDGEDGIDSGGITTEWYQLLTRALFAPSAGLMQCREASKRYALDRVPRGPTENVRWHEDQLFMLGRIMAKAVYDKRVVNAPFCTYIYKHLLGREPDMEDLRQVDPVFHQSLEWMLHHDITDMIFETMSLRDDDGIEHDLIPGGEHVDVTEDNKREYVDRVVAWRLTTSVKAPLDRLCAGFHELLPPAELEDLRVEDLELLVNGSDDIPVADLRAAARYANGYSARSKTVQYFWSFFEKASPSRQAALLAFATGSSKMPLEPLSLQIVKSQEPSEALPTSHTCFQQLVIPDYEGGLAQLEEKFELALEHAAQGGFGLT
ncbi:E3 ubiquitin-protein ligase UPL1 [Hondaea fermentalgiana]|uniref:HECT-type E3 ubiquitin transferase n=1 Tax=Hondaea fermentalgiana TaxID=2315210 RepID=A0A2R5GVN0_9STRA|nr:E3 ubiquitin-protein ligase UPL1 [Hondaea fermentalgiana]|eukprot:GBG31974.1 E3 ubiquitin-protein ligase UPL1 [Hondaea fermentalgiana]